MALNSFISSEKAEFELALIAYKREATRLRGLFSNYKLRISSSASSTNSMRTQPFNSPLNLRIHWYAVHVDPWSIRTFSFELYTWIQNPIRTFSIQ
jgi:hypothetical protein